MEKFLKLFPGATAKQNKTCDSNLRRVQVRWGSYQCANN